MKINIINKSSFNIPEYKTDGSSGLDLQANSFPNNKDVYNISPGETILIKTGLFIDIPIGIEGQIRPRSGLSLKRGLTAILGTIDSDYTGEIGIILHNNSNFTWDLNKGDRLAQIVFAPIVKIDFNEVKDIKITERGVNGFGSTGLK